MSAMPTRILRPRPLAWLMYTLMMASGLAFGLTDDAASVRTVVGDWGPLVTALMLLTGGIIGIIGSIARVYALELSAYPFLVGVWMVYAVAIAARSVHGPTPAGFAFLLGAGAVGLAGRAVELHHAGQITQELAQRQANRGVS